MTTFIIWTHDNGRDARTLSAPSMLEALEQAALLFNKPRAEIRIIDAREVSRCRDSLGEELAGIFEGMAEPSAQ